MNIKDNFHKAKNYAVYYGYNRADELMNFDMVIVEPGGQTPESLQRIKEKGIPVLAYLSVTEVNPSFPIYKLLKEEDFLKTNGQLLKNADFGNYVVDLRSKKWQDILLHTAGSLLLLSGYDGLFLDTVGNAELPEVYSEYGDSVILAAVEFMQLVKSRFKNCLIVQNNGLEMLSTYSYEIVDGICWENPPFGKSGSEVWTDEILRRLEVYSSKNKTKIMLLIETDNPDRSDAASRVAARLAEEKGYLLYIAPCDYAEGIYYPGEK